jgi:2-methylisocitrate lyase-like PEP mutase family enzyme
MSGPASDQASLRDLLKQDRVLMAPGVFDALSAVLVERAGFPLAFLSGAALSFSRYGLPDLGFTTLTQLADSVAPISARIRIPLLVDADTGFGNALSTQVTVRELERAGAAGLVLEDQVAPKRCGHMAGKQVVPVREMVGKLRAALDARRSESMVVVARTDALHVEGIDAAIDRASAYLEAGADALFIEGPRTVEQMRAVAERLGDRAPLLHNMVEGGATPVRTADQLAEFKIRIALYPAFLVHFFAHEAPAMLERLAKEGGSDGMHDMLCDLKDMNTLLGADELLRRGAHYGGELPPGQKADVA